MDQHAPMLGSYEEAVGTFDHLEETPHSIAVHFASFTILLPKKCSHLLFQALSSDVKGQHIGILRTDIPDQPVLVTVDNDKTTCNHHD